MITRTFTMAVAAGVLVISLTGCSSDSGIATTAPAVTATTPTVTTPTPRLLTWEKNPNSSAVTAALVSGKLTVNDAGCVAVGSAILMAPPGSSALPESAGISMAGHGEFKVGDTVKDLPGGYWDITGKSTDPEGVTECRSKSSPEREYAVVWSS